MTHVLLLAESESERPQQLSLPPFTRVHLLDPYGLPPQLNPGERGKGVSHLHDRSTTTLRSNGGVDRYAESRGGRQPPLACYAASGRRHFRADFT